jgi:hypothetical protein
MRIKRYLEEHKVFLAVGALFVTVGTLALLGTGLTLSRSGREGAIAYASATTQSIAADLDRIIAEHELMAVTMASMLGSDPSRDREKIIRMLVDLFSRSKWVVATYAGYEPNAFDGDDKPWVGKPAHNPLGQFVPFIHTQSSLGMIHEPSKIFVDSLRDIDTYDFYMGPKRTNAPFITPPWTFRDHATGNLNKIVCLTAPIQWPDGSFRGMAGVNIDTRAILDRYNSIDAFEHGMVFTIYKDGLLLTWPDANLTFTHTILDIGERFGKANLNKLVADIAAGRKGVVNALHPVTGRKAWLVYYPVPTCEWGVVAVVPRVDIFHVRNRVLIIEAASLVILLGAIFAFILRKK